MHRRTFLTIMGVIGSLVGSVALLAPTVLLGGKGVPPEGAPTVWMRETGILIVALSAMLLLLRTEPDSRALRVVLWGNALAHAGLLPIELCAWHAGVITRFDGIAPNSALHLLAVCGFAAFATRPGTWRRGAAD